MNGNDQSKRRDIEPHKMPVAYIAGALNDMSCDYIQNVRRMILWGEKIRALGFAVFVPGIDFLCGVVTGEWDYGVAFSNSQPFLARADIMFVCPKWQDSKGTSKEIVTATNLFIPIYYEQAGLDLLKRRLRANTAFGRPFFDPDIADDIAREQYKPLHDTMLKIRNQES